MIVRKIFFGLVSLFSLPVFTQNPDSPISKPTEPFLFAKRNSLNFEAFGHGLFYSLSYERIIINEDPYKWALQIGGAVYPYHNQIDIWLPISLNFIKTVGIKRKHHIEAGVGHVLRYDQFYNGYMNNPWQTFITAKVGYRFQKSDGRWIFKILLTPFYEYDRKNPPTTPAPKSFHNIIDGNGFPSGALSVGYTF